MQQETIQPAGGENKIIRAVLILLASAWLALCLSAASLGAGYLLGSSVGSESDPVFDPFFQAWDIIHDEYVKQPVDDTQLLQGAINGMMQSLGDENSTYMDPEFYEQATSSLEGYVGIGIVADMTGEYLKVQSIFPGSPAEQAGLKVGDEIVKVDGQDMTGLDAQEVRAKILGPAGTHVQLAVRRPGETELLEFDLVRAKIEVPVVESRMLEEGIGYLRLAQFSSSSPGQVREALTALLAENPEGLILDLRQNPGGEVVAAEQIGAQFLPENTLLFYQMGKDGNKVDSYTGAGGLATTIPLVVLVDGGSASASEIVAGAIQDHQRALLVGTKTYGKGSVQKWIPLVNNMGAVRITVALWYTPSGRQIADQGLTPDVEVSITEEEYQAGRDPQLERAIELLQEGKGV
jgi:carboxyl-terminal processing protease